MKQNNHIQTEMRVKSAFEKATPDVLDSILAECHHKKGRIVVMTNEKKHFNYKKCMIACAACFAMVLGIFAGYSIFQEDASFTTVMLDVNPSLEIKANENEKVIEVLPLNEDAKIVMGNMDFEGSSLELTVNALIGSMLRNGYINEITNSVLVSVNSKDEATGKSIKEKLSAEISAMINTDTISGSVISQIVSGEDTELVKLSEQNGITLGKAKLIQSILKANPDKKAEELVSLSITELNLILSAVTADSDINNNFDWDLDVDGVPSQKGYIGRAAALTAAEQYYNVSEEQISNTPWIELTIQNGTICYFVKFERLAGYYTYQYRAYINAVTGLYVSGGYSYSYDAPEGQLTPEKGCHDVAFEIAGCTKETAENLQIVFNKDDYEVMVFIIDFDYNGNHYHSIHNGMTTETLLSEVTPIA